MLKTVLFSFFKKVIVDFINSGKLNDLAKHVLNGTPVASITAVDPSATNTLKDVLMQALVAALKSAIASGQFNDFVIKLLGGLLGSKNLPLPVTTTVVVDVTASDDKLIFHHSDGSQHEVTI